MASPKREQKIPAHLSIEEMNTLLEMPDRTTPLGRRDQAMLELFYASGLRLSELVGLDLEDVNLASRVVRVLGKGGKERQVPLNQQRRLTRSARTSAIARRSCAARSPRRARPTKTIRRAGAGQLAARRRQRSRGVPRATRRRSIRCS